MKEKETEAKGMPAPIVYEYCVVRYVADIEREEFLNIGLMMMCKRIRWMRCEILINEERIKGCFAKADVERLRTQAQIFQKSDVPAPDLPVEERYRWLAAVKSAIIQTSTSRPGIIPQAAALPPEEIKTVLNNKFNQLFSRLIP